jgi:peptidyl-prolyl cis-trans isomerase A (cyclophilin A)
MTKLIRFFPAMIFAFSLSASAHPGHGDINFTFPTGIGGPNGSKNGSGGNAPPQPTTYEPAKYAAPSYGPPVYSVPSLPEPPGPPPVTLEQVQQFQQFQQQQQQLQAQPPTPAIPERPAPREEKYVPSEVVSAVQGTRTTEVRAVLRTSLGDITILLDRNRVPNTVNHFVGLARGDKEFIDVKTSKRVKRPFYNGLIFHRVTKNFLIQTGCPFGNGRGGPGDIATIKDEIKPPMNFDRPGLVAMAPMRDATGKKTKKDTNGSQFFITLAPMKEWNDQFTIFGEVEDGMDVVKKIASVKVGPTERPIKRVYLIAVDIFEGDVSKAAPQVIDAPEPTSGETNPQ